MKALFFLLSLSISSCYGQTKNADMKETNPLLCDIETGMCETPEKETNVKNAPNKEQAVKIIYFTDPICSSCWAIEPQLRKLKLEYGHLLEIDYRMGGLLPDWSYNSGGISGPKDVAKHWDEVSLHYDMPIDGDVWLEDPMNSSYPPSIAFKAAQIQDKQKAIDFMRKLRELLFLEKKNIEKWENVEKAALFVGLDTKQLKNDIENTAPALFQADLQLAKEMGVRGFPSIFVTNGKETEFIYGSRPYPVFEGAVLKLFPTAEKKVYAKDWESLFTKFKSLTAKEYSVLSEQERKASEEILQKLVQEKKLRIITTKNGNLYFK